MLRHLAGAAPTFGLAYPEGTGRENPLWRAPWDAQNAWAPAIAGSAGLVWLLRAQEEAGVDELGAVVGAELDHELVEDFEVALSEPDLDCDLGLGR